MLSRWFVFFLSISTFSKPVFLASARTRTTPRLARVTLVALLRTLEEEELESPWDVGIIATYFSEHYKALVPWKLPAMPVPLFHSPTSSYLIAGFGTLGLLGASTLCKCYEFIVFPSGAFSVVSPKLFCKSFESFFTNFLKLSPLALLKPSLVCLSVSLYSMCISIYTDPCAHVNMHMHINVDTQYTCIHAYIEICRGAKGSENERMEVRQWSLDSQEYEVCS